MSNEDPMDMDHLDMTGAGPVIANEITGRVGLLLDRIGDLERRLERAQYAQDEAQDRQTSYAGAVSRLTKERAAMLSTVHVAIEAIRPTAPSGAIELLEELFGADGSGYATYAPDGRPEGSPSDFVTGTWVVGYERAVTQLGRLCRSINAGTEPALDVLKRIPLEPINIGEINRAATMLSELRLAAATVARDPFVRTDPEPEIEGVQENGGDDDSDDGLYRKYEVARVDGKPLGPRGCIVLECDDAKAHPALLVWAQTMEATGRPYLAADVRELVRVAMFTTTVPEER